MEFLFKQFFFIFLTVKEGPSVRVEKTVHKFVIH